MFLNGNKIDANRVFLKIIYDLNEESNYMGSFQIVPPDIIR